MKLFVFKIYTFFDILKIKISLHTYNEYIMNYIN